MKTLYVMKGMLFCYIVTVCSPLLLSKENPEAQLVLQALSIPKKPNAYVYKIILDEDQEADYQTSFHIIEPKISREASRSRKKDNIIELVDDGVENIDSALKVEGVGKLNAPDFEYMKYYRTYIAWKKAVFNVIYIVTSKPTKSGPVKIMGALTAYKSPMNAESYFEKKGLYSIKQLDSMQWNGIFPGTITSHFENTIARMDAEDITILPTKPSRKQIEESVRSRLINAVALGLKDVNIYHIPMQHFTIVQSALVPPSPSMLKTANLSKKKDIIMEAIEEGESDIPSYIKANGGGSMNLNDHEFAKYYSMLLRYEGETFQSAFVATKRNAKTIEIIGLLVGSGCIIPTTECLENVNKVYLPKEMLSVGVGTDKISLMDYLKNIILDKFCQKIYP